MLVNYIIDAGIVQLREEYEGKLEKETETLDQCNQQLKKEEVN